MFSEMLIKSFLCLLLKIVKRQLINNFEKLCVIYILFNQSSIFNVLIQYFLNYFLFERSKYYNILK